MSSDGDTAEPGACCNWRQHVLPTLSIFAVFAATSLMRAPVPAVNEPHYLAKAKHFWNPQWCAGDFFLESSNPHFVFYAAVGWLTTFLTLEAVAYAGRAAGLLLLAWGWHRLASQLVRTRWGEAASASLFVLLGALGTFSGEWVVGGIESKVFAYALILWAGAYALERRWNRAAMLLGGAVSFHPVVGCWCVASASLAAAIDHLRLSRETSCDPAHVGEPRSGWPRLLLPTTLLTLVSLPGMIPALQIVVGVEPELARQADAIQANWRIGHHIDPMLFPFSSYRFYGLLLVIWLLLSRLTAATRGGRSVQRFVAATLVIAAAGLVVGWSPAVLGEGAREFKLRIIKFYPFRLADAAVPAVIAWLAAGASEQAARKLQPRGGAALTGLLTLFAAALTLLLPAPDANASGMTPEVRRHWIATLAWIRSHTPADALLATANEEWAVKWFAHRPEYVSFKDAPQDPAGTVEWRRRRLTLENWSRASKRDGVLSAEELALLHGQTGIDYLIVSRYGGFEMEPVFRQGPFRVYRVAAD